MPDCCYSWPWRAPPRPIGSDIALTSQSLASSGASLPPGGRRRRSTRHRTSGRQGQERHISCVSVVPPLLLLCPSCAAALTASVLWSWSRRRNRPSCASWNGRCCSLPPVFERVGRVLGGLRARVARLSFCRWSRRSDRGAHHSRRGVLDRRRAAPNAARGLTFRRATTHAPPDARRRAPPFRHATTPRAARHRRAACGGGGVVGRHFMMAEFLPALSLALRAPNRTLALRHGTRLWGHGPFDGFYAEVEGVARRNARVEDSAIPSLAQELESPTGSTLRGRILLARVEMTTRRVHKDPCIPNERLASLESLVASTPMRSRWRVVDMQMIASLNCPEMAVGSSCWIPYCTTRASHTDGFFRSRGRIRTAERKRHPIRTVPSVNGSHDSAPSRRRRRRRAARRGRADRAPRLPGGGSYVSVVEAPQSLHDTSSLLKQVADRARQAGDGYAIVVEAPSPYTTRHP